MSETPTVYLMLYYMLTPSYALYICLLSAGGYKNTHFTDKDPEIQVCKFPKVAQKGEGIGILQLLRLTKEPTLLFSVLGMLSSAVLGTEKAPMSEWIDGWVGGWISE